eukprot:9005653-Alexandrium_andersonii.AAC.1
MPRLLLTCSPGGRCERTWGVTRRMHSQLQRTHPCVAAPVPQHPAPVGGAVRRELCHRVPALGGRGRQACAPEGPTKMLR